MGGGGRLQIYLANLVRAIYLTHKISELLLNIVTCVCAPENSSMKYSCLNTPNYNTSWSSLNVPTCDPGNCIGMYISSELLKHNMAKIS